MAQLRAGRSQLHYAAILHGVVLARTLGLVEFIGAHLPTEEAIMIHGKLRVPMAGRPPAVSVDTDTIISLAFAPAA